MFPCSFKSRRVTTTALFGVLAAFPAAAQTVNSGAGIQQSQALSTPSATAPKPIPTQHLFGTWGGLLPRLHDHGVDVIIDNWAEYGGNITGGIRDSGTGYAGQVAAQVNVDFGKMFQDKGILNNLVLHSSVINRNGRSFGRRFDGDELYNPEQIYGGGKNTVAHLVYLYLEKKSDNQRLALAVGRYTIGADFAASPLNCIFMSLTVCGNPRALNNSNGWAAWPASNWAARLRVRPTAETYVQTGLFEASVHKGGSAGFYWRLDDATGLITPVELGWEPVRGRNRLTGHYKLGFIHDSSTYNDNYLDVDGAPYQLSHRPPARHHGQTSSYVTFDQMLFRTGQYQNQGLILLGGYVHGDHDTARLENQGFGGFTWSGLIPSRTRDALSILVSYWQYSSRITEQDELSYAIAHTPLDDRRIRTHQTVIEATYNIHAFRGIDISPDFQYGIRPRSTDHIPDAAFLGVNAHVTL